MLSATELRRGIAVLRRRRSELLRKERELKKTRSAAVLTLFDAAKMTPQGKRAIAGWLRRQAAALVGDGQDYTPRFTAKYLYQR